MTPYLTLFAVSFLAATILPAYSEVLFAALISQGYDPWLFLAWATAGNTLGACLNWVLGRSLLHYQDKKWFPFREEHLGSAQRWFNKYGVWSLLMAWAPIGGDALTFIAGILRVPFPIFVLLTGIGKGARYLILLGLVPVI